MLQETEHHVCESAVSDHDNGLLPQTTPRQPRRFERKPLHIQAHLKINDKTICCEAHDISPGGLGILSDTALTPGTSLELKFAFGDICYLNLSGQVVYCLVTEKDGIPHHVGVKFAGLRDWEQIIISALKDLALIVSVSQKPFLTIHATQDGLAQEAARLYADPSSKFRSPQQLQALPSGLTGITQPETALPTAEYITDDVQQDDLVVTELGLPSAAQIPHGYRSPDRRRSPRIDVRIETSILVNETSHEGTAVNISLSGIYILCSDMVQLVENQHCELRFVTEGLILNIMGTLRGLREFSNLDEATSRTTFGLAITFDMLRTPKVQMFASLLEGMRERSTSVKLTVIVISEETGDLLLEVCSAKSNIMQSPDVHSSHYSEGSFPLKRRLATRRKADTIGHVEPFDSFPVRTHRAFPATNNYAHSRSLHIPHKENERQLEPGAARWSSPRIGHPETKQVVSTFVQCRNANGYCIAAYHDYPKEALHSGAPVVVISPGYGETKKEYITLAYYLACSGFHVLRYDHTNHVGESEGGILNTTLTGMKQDLSDVLDYAERTWPASPLVVIANSLAGRVALKLAGQESRIGLLILLNSVIDIRATLLAVHQEDFIGNHDSRIHGGVVNILGYNIDSDHWLEDTIGQKYSDLRTTILDIEQIHTPVILFHAEHDVWVCGKSVEQAQAALGSNLRHAYIIPEALHCLHENPKKARAVFHQVVTCCREQFDSTALKTDASERMQREIGLQKRLERERSRTQTQMGGAESAEFWRDYLDHFHYIVKSPDYLHLLDHVYSLAGISEKGECILDAGCGNGNFGMFLLINQAYRQRNTKVKCKPPHYVGIDFIPNAITHTRLNLAKVTADIQRRLPNMSRPQPMEISLGLANLNTPLPFRDNQFDRVICNLVIGYLQDPLFTLKELVRVLSPNGKIILTNLKPQADLSAIYRNFIRLTQRREEIEEARAVLSNSGKIKQGESDGVFFFCDKQELAMLLLSSGAIRPRTYSTFVNQAYIAVAEKPVSAHISPLVRDQSPS